MKNDREWLLEAALVCVAVGLIVGIGLYAIDSIADTWVPGPTTTEYMADMEEMQMMGY